MNGACEGYTPVLNKQGKDVVIGAVAFEGYITGACFYGVQTHLITATPAASTSAVLQRAFTRTVGHCMQFGQAMCTLEKLSSFCF